MLQHCIRTLGILSHRAHLKYTRGSQASVTCGWHRPVSPQLYHARSVLCKPSWPCDNAQRCQARVSQACKHVPRSVTTQRTEHKLGGLRAMPYEQAWQAQGRACANMNPRKVTMSLCRSPLMYMKTITASSASSSTIMRPGNA